MNSFFFYEHAIFRTFWSNSFLSSREKLLNGLCFLYLPLLSTFYLNMQHSRAFYQFIVWFSSQKQTTFDNRQKLKMLYGILLESCRDGISTVFGQQTWKRIVQELNLEHETFTILGRYEENMIERIAECKSFFPFFLS
jgi:hypothetical protein